MQRRRGMELSRECDSKFPVLLQLLSRRGRGDDRPGEPGTMRTGGFFYPSDGKVPSGGLWCVVFVEVLLLNVMACGDFLLFCC